MTEDTPVSGVQLGQPDLLDPDRFTLELGFIQLVRQFCVVALLVMPPLLAVLPVKYYHCNNDDRNDRGREYLVPPLHDTTLPIRIHRYSPGYLFLLFLLYSLSMRLERPIMPKVNAAVATMKKIPIPNLFHIFFPSLGSYACSGSPLLQSKCNGSCGYKQLAGLLC